MRCPKFRIRSCRSIGITENGPALKTRRRRSAKRALIGGFDNAWNGIVHAVLTQRNLRFHLAVAVFVVVLGLLLRVSLVEFAVLTLTIAVVLASELVNTAVEAVVDLVTEEYHPLAKIAKDAAAGAVLVCSICAVFVGVFIFWDEVLELFARATG